jgi:hypothetical protein
MTANKLAITNATLQPSFIAGVTALMVRVTAGRKTPSVRAACPTKLMVMGAFQLSYFETRSASEISSSVASRRGLLPFRFVRWSLPHINSRVKQAHFYKGDIKNMGHKEHGT